MALGSLVDSPLQQNPLAGGGFSGALEAPAPTYNELQGDALVKQISMRLKTTWKSSISKSRMICQDDWMIGQIHCGRSTFRTIVQ